MTQTPVLSKRRSLGRLRMRFYKGLTMQIPDPRRALQLAGGQYPVNRRFVHP
jgi:hypothetical protein